VTPLHLDYATRDYDGFRQLLVSVIDRHDTAWTERAAADLGIMVVELLAYELDRLAYAGDRVAEEGFLATARRRESARRHAALGDHVLDRGNATRGFQWLQLAAGQRISLPARALLTGSDPRDRSAAPVYAETLDATALDAARNRFSLVQSVPAGSKVLRLGAGTGGTSDLRDVGLAAGMWLVLGIPLSADVRDVMPGDPPLQLATGEVVRVARVMPHGVELVHALQRTWPGGDEGAWVLGNIVEVRRGLTSAWTLIGRGGAALGDIAHDQYLQLRMEIVRRLRMEVEAVRASWIDRPAQHAQWTSACKAMTALRKRLEHTVVTALDLRNKDDRDELTELAAALEAAADQLRGILTAIGHDIPDALGKTDRVAVPHQTIPDGKQVMDLPLADQPVLWMDPDAERPARSETLAIAVGTAGAWTRWIEQPDLLRSAPDDPHYVVELDGNARITLRFGDGTSGAVLPADAQVMARWVTGDQSGDDLRAGALGGEVSVDGKPIAAVTATSNPLATTGGRAPEDLDGIAARVERGLEQPAVPVTAEDYRLLLSERDGIVESAVSLVHGVVDIVVRPAGGPDAGIDAGQLLDDTRTWLDANRLAGTTVSVRPPRPLPIDIGLAVDVHPDVSADELRYLVQQRLAEAFGDAPQDAAGNPRPVLGAPRELGEVYHLVEDIPGVRWSQVVVFDLAGRTPARVLDRIVPAADQVVRCAAVDDQPVRGQVTLWAARRYALQLTVTYDALDNRPDLDAIRAVLPSLLSGPASIPVRHGWSMLTAALIDRALAGVFAGAGFTAKVTRLIASRRAVDQIELGARELPILDTATVVDGGVDLGLWRAR
jgi:hypothetical protein